jgi:hypothetical protein
MRMQLNSPSNATQLRARLGAAACLLLASGLPAAVRAADPPAKPEEAAKALAAARTKGLDWLAKNQNADGSWGKTYTIAVTSFTCLSFLSAADEPFDGDRGKALVKGLQFLMAQQKDGEFPQQGHTWIHGQGFGTLALSEAYGRTLLCKIKPDMDPKKVKTAVAGAVKVIVKNQSTTGGWWYTQNGGAQQEGSTTVCAVQALASAANYGIDVDQKALDHGFDYLKKSQLKDGGFVYKLGDAVSMKEGSAGDVATLGLMQKFDFKVMVSGYKYLLDVGPAAIGGGNFPEYGCFYSCMGMHLLGEEYKDDKDYHDKTADFIAGVQKVVLAWQDKDGSYPVRGWTASGGQEGPAFATAFSTLTLFVPEGRLSIYNREPPKLPEK